VAQVCILPSEKLQAGGIASGFLWQAEILPY
jgi:hypothetical protein